MNANLDLLKLSFCGPGDVAKELKIAQEVVAEWNLLHAERCGFWVKHQHWSTDSHPDMSDRPQGVINRQMIDEAQIIVAIFWSRFGTPTGVAASGTEEEIRRAMRQERKVMIYFSNLEPLPPTAQKPELDRLWEFRSEMRTQGLVASFSSRDEFRRIFRQHLAQALNERLPKRSSEKAPARQVINGNHNNQAGRDLHVYAHPPVVKEVIERRLGSISAAEETQVSAWIEELAEGTIGMSRSRAYSMWWSRLKNRFAVKKAEALASVQMTDVEGWYRQQRAIQKRGLKRKAPDEWRRSRITAVKAVMGKIGVPKEKFYADVAVRLKMKRGFVSLNDLTNTDLDRVYNLVLRDARGPA